MRDHMDGEVAEHVGLYRGQSEARDQRQPQLGAGRVVERAPKPQGVVGSEQSVGEHHGPRPRHRPQLPKGVEQQVKLQHQPDQETIKKKKNIGDILVRRGGWGFRTQKSKNTVRLTCFGFERHLFLHTFSRQLFFFFF